MSSTWGRSTPGHRWGNELQRRAQVLLGHLPLNYFMLDDVNYGYMLYTSTFSQNFGNLVNDPSGGGRRAPPFSW